MVDVDKDREERVNALQQLFLTTPSIAKLVACTEPSKRTRDFLRRTLGDFLSGIKDVPSFWDLWALETRADLLDRLVSIHFQFSKLKRSTRNKPRGLVMRKDFHLLNKVLTKVVEVDDQYPPNLRFQEIRNLYESVSS